MTQISAALGEKLGVLIQANATFVAGMIVGLAYGWKLTLVVLARARAPTSSVPAASQSITVSPSEAAALDTESACVRRAAFHSSSPLARSTPRPGPSSQPPSTEHTPTQAASRKRRRNSWLL